MPNFFATTRYNVPYISTHHSHNRFAGRAKVRDRKRPRDETDSEDEIVTGSDGMEELHRFCSQCFPPPTISTPGAILRRNRQLLKEEDLWPDDDLDDFRYGMFHCAMLRGHKDCMMEMHKRGIGSEFSPMGRSNFAPHLAILTDQRPDMLTFLHQLGHDFRNTSMAVAQAIVDADDDDDAAVEVVELVVHEFGAVFHQWSLLQFLKMSKLHLVARRFDRNALSGAREVAFMEYTTRWDRPAEQLHWVLLEVIRLDRPDLLHQLLMMAAEDNAPSFLELRSPVVLPAAVLRYTMSVVDHPVVLPEAVQSFMTNVVGTPPYANAFKVAKVDVVGSLLSRQVEMGLV